MKFASAWRLYPAASFLFDAAQSVPFEFLLLEGKHFAALLHALPSKAIKRPVKSAKTVAVNVLMSRRAEAAFSRKSCQ